MPLMTRIPYDLRDFGLTVEVVPGADTRGSVSFAPAAVVCHWTAGPRGTTGRPSLGVVVNGRADLDGPLCNVYLARDGVCVYVAAGRANHAGLGGYRGLLGNSAVYGIEAESGGDGDWTPAQRDAYPRLVAALLSGLGRDASWACGHNEWAPTRKIDIRDWPMPTMRGSVAARLAEHAAPTPPPSEEDEDMFIVRVGEVPHMLVGDRYFPLDSWATARAFETAGVKRVEVGDAAHKVLVTNLGSEKADPPPKATT